MAKAKKCQVGHAGCNCTLMCCSIAPARVEEIRASVAAGRGRSMFEDRPAVAQCRCGVPRKPPGTSKHVNDDGRCLAHPDRPPMKYARGAERYEAREILQPPTPGGSVWILLGQG